MILQYKNRDVLCVYFMKLKDENTFYYYLLVFVRQKSCLIRFQILFCMLIVCTIVHLVVVHSTTVILSYRKCSGLCCYSRVGGKKWGYAPGPQSFYGQKCLKFWLLFGMLKKVHLWGLFFLRGLYLRGPYINYVHVILRN